MRRRIGWLILALLVSTPALAGKVYVDWDREYDFGPVDGFAWGAEGTPARSELAERKIRDMIATQLSGRGVVEVEAPVVVVVTHAIVDSHTQSKASVGLSVGRATSWGGVRVGGSRPVGSTTTEIGTLIIQMRDAATGQLVWEARATETVSGKPEKVEAKIERAIEKALHDFPPGPKSKSKR